MRKSEYRSLFAECKQFIKFNNICKIIGLNPSTFYMFMKSDAYDWMLSVEKLENIRLEILKVYEKIV